MALDEREQRIVNTIHKEGWVVMKVSPNSGDLQPRWFAYTIGLPVTHGWPELICFGPRVDAAAQFVNNAVFEMKRNALRPATGLALDEVMEGYPTRLESFPSSFFVEHLGWAIWFSQYRALEQKEFDCLQLVWPDKNGYFPSNPSCHPDVQFIQTPVITARD